MKKILQKQMLMQEKKHERETVRIALHCVFTQFVDNNILGEHILGRKCSVW